jgi:hypothetical protein
MNSGQIDHRHCPIPWLRSAAAKTGFARAHPAAEKPVGYQWARHDGSDRE